GAPGLEGEAGADGQDVPHGGDHPDDQEGLELQLGRLEVGEDGAQQLEDDDHEEHTVDGGGDPYGELVAGGEKVGGGAVEDDDGEGAQHPRADGANRSAQPIENGR